MSINCNLVPFYIFSSFLVVAWFKSLKPGITEEIFSTEEIGSLNIAFFFLFIMFMESFIAGFLFWAFFVFLCIFGMILELNLFYHGDDL